jgi:hypothetical protein
MLERLALTSGRRSVQHENGFTAEWRGAPCNFRDPGRPLDWSWVISGGAVSGISTSGGGGATLGKSVSGASVVSGATGNPNTL